VENERGKKKVGANLIVLAEKNENAGGKIQKNTSRKETKGS